MLIKALQSAFALSVLKYFPVRCNTCNLYFALWQIFSICFLKHNLSTIVIPSQKTSHDFSISFPSRYRFTLMSVFIPNIMNWNLPEFRFHEFNLNHFEICPKSNFRLCNISPNNFPQELIVLSSTKITYIRFWDKRKA